MDWVPCGKCNFCLKRSRSEWSFRLFQELKAAQSAAFLTLTYDPLSVVYSVDERKANLEPSHLKAFIRAFRDREAKVGRKRYRRAGVKRWRNRAIRYYAVGEYGGMGEELLGEGRPHFHVLLFNFNPDTMARVQEIWGRGQVDVGEVEPASIAYVSGYVINRHQDYGKRHRPFTSISRSNGGLGSQYLTPQMVRYHKVGKRNYGMHEGYKVPLPRLYKDRIFSKHQKQVMRVAIAKEMDNRFLDEVERLSVLHADPVNYYQMKLDQAYARVRVVKSKKSRGV